MRKGYPLKSHQVRGISVRGEARKNQPRHHQLDKIKLAAEIKSLSPDFMVVSVEGSQSGSAPSIKEIAARFPDIAPLVQAYGDRSARILGTGNWPKQGKKSAPFNTKRKWSFGSPLKMPVALRRTLVPALEALAGGRDRHPAYLARQPVLRHGQDPLL